MKRISGNTFFIMLILTAALFCFTMCNQDSSVANENQPTSQLVSHTDCKSSLGNIHSDEHTSSEDCIDYIYTIDGTLQLTHVNTGFNCCPGELTADITVNDNLIIIEEHEEVAGCHCDCLYDIEYRIENLNAGIYTIKIITPYVDEAEQLEFTMDLTTDTTGSFCMERDYYPWGEF